MNGFSKTGVRALFYGFLFIETRVREPRAQSYLKAALCIYKKDIQRLVCAYAKDLHSKVVLTLCRVQLALQIARATLLINIRGKAQQVRLSYLWEGEFWTG